MTAYKYRAGTGRTRTCKASEVPLRVPNIKRHTFSVTDSELVFLNSVSHIPCLPQPIPSPNWVSAIFY